MTHTTGIGYDEDVRHMRRGQSSIIILLVVIMLFVGVVVFLLNLAGTVNREEFTNLYVNNLLLSVMRTDTGYTDSNCKLVSDLVFCAYFTPEWECGGKSCLRLANETMQEYMAIFGNETKSMRYLFTATPEFAAFSSGEPISLDIGDTALKSSKDSVKRYSYPIVITKTVGLNQHTLKVQLAVAKK
jgi:hypothetical protein